MIRSIFHHDSDHKAQLPLFALAEDIRNLSDIARQRQLIPYQGRFLGLSTMVKVPRACRVDNGSLFHDRQLVISASEVRRGPRASRLGLHLVDPNVWQERPHHLPGRIGSLSLQQVGPSVTPALEIDAEVSWAEQKTTSYFFSQLLGGRDLDQLVSDTQLNHLQTIVTDAPGFVVQDRANQIRYMTLERLYPG